MGRQHRDAVSNQDADSFIQRVAESTGLIAVESKAHESDEEAIVTFMHHSFLEYFAALGLSRELTDLNILSLVNEPRWHEVLTLLAGIIGEHEDIAPTLSRILADDAVAHDIDAKLLTFAMDCALECEVPSEAAQRLIARAIKRCLLSGAARLDPWVRSEIGQRVAQLFSACGGKELDDLIIELILQGDEQAASATVELMSYAFASGYDSERIISAFNRATTRTEDGVLCAICAAAGRAESLRTDSSLQLISRSIQKSKRRRQKALEALASIPDLASKHWPDILSGIEDNNRTVSRFASLAAINAGLNGDLISIIGSKRDILVKALRNFDFSNASSGVINGRGSLKKDTVSLLLSSSKQQDKILGIQLLPYLNNQSSFVYETIFSILRTNADAAEMGTALHSLQQSVDALHLCKASDLKLLAVLSAEGTVNIRTSAIRLLGIFGNESACVESLLSLKPDDMQADEYTAYIMSLAQVRIQLPRIQEAFEEQCSELLAMSVKRNDANVEKTRALLNALRRTAADVSTSTAARIAEIPANYRYDEEVRRMALVTASAVVTPSNAAIETLISFYEAPPLGMESELSRIPSVFAAKCRRSMEYVLACVRQLPALKATAIAFHTKLSRRAPTDETEFMITELRKGISDLSEIIMTFEEFIRPTELEAR